MIGFRDDTWAVVDPAGRFDAANGGDVNGLHWVVDNESVSLDQLKERYYDPGLLAKYLGFNKEPLREVTKSSFTNPKLYPAVALTPPTEERPELGIKLTNRGGGIGRVVVMVNGKEITADARGPAPKPDASELALDVDLSDDPRLKPGEPNVIEVQAYNAEGYLRSRGLTAIYTPRGRKLVKPELWAIVVGVSDYRGDKIDLRYAAKDAEDFATALRVSAGRLFGIDQVHLKVLTTTQEDAGAKPTRDNIKKAFEAARKARTADVLVLYVAGHGVNYGGQDGDFYFLTSDARTSGLSDPAVRKQTAVSSQELTAWIKQIPALKQVMILDTCASGRFIEKLTAKRHVPSSQIRALDRLKDRTGLHILAGCSADRVSYKATRYAQGLLTYSLLIGMKGAALREHQYVDVGRLFAYATDQVPQLAKDIGGIQTPLLAVPSGGTSFDIGRLTNEDKARIPHESVRPLFLRANFQEEKQFKDVLGLGRLVDERLRNASTRGRRAPLVFVDATEFPQAYKLVGRYRVEEDKVTVAVKLFLGTKGVQDFTVPGQKSKAAELAQRIVTMAQEHLSRK